MVEYSIIEQAFIIAMSVLTLWVGFQEGEMLSFVKKLTWNWPWWINKPLHVCLICMTLWWGLLMITLLGGNYLSAFVATGINVIVDKIIGYGEDFYSGPDNTLN